MPLAPGRFSTITCWPSRSLIFGAIRRDMVSVVLPGGNGMTIRIGFDGYGWASALAANKRGKRQNQVFIAILRRMILRALLLFIACGAAFAQDYPAKPVRVIVGFPPGGATDLVMRVLQPGLARELGREVVIDNRPGANGIVGAELAARAQPDGYTLHLGTFSSLVISPAISKVPYDATRDFTPIPRLVELQT